MGENIIMCINCNLLYNKKNQCLCNEYLKSPAVCTSCKHVLYECYCSNPTIGQVILNEPIIHEKKQTKIKSCILCQGVDASECTVHCVNKHAYCKYCANILSFIQLGTCLKCPEKLSLPVLDKSLTCRKTRFPKSVPNLCRICKTNFYFGDWCNCIGVLNCYNIPQCRRCDRMLYCHMHERISSTCDVCRAVCTCTLSIVGNFLFFNTNAQQLELACEQNLTFCGRNIGTPISFTRIKTKTDLLSSSLKHFPRTPYKCPICLTHKTTFDICVNLHRVCKLCNTIDKATNNKCPVCRWEFKTAQIREPAIHKKYIWNITQANLYSRLDDYRNM